MGNASHGREVAPPPGFERKLSILGTELRLRYFWTLKEKPAGVSLDGYLHPNGRQVWLAVYGRTIASISDALFHELVHWALCYYPEKDKKGILGEEDDREEQFTLLVEAAMPGVLRNNLWFRRLFDPTYVDAIDRIRKLQR